MFLFNTSTKRNVAWMSGVWFCSMFASMVCAQTVMPASPQRTVWSPPAGATAYQLPLSEQRIVSSPQGDYQIMISWPQIEVPPEGFPVVYVLDGNAVFGTVTEAARRLARPYGTNHKPLPAPVVVALGYPGVIGVDRERRIFDYTPPAERYVETGHIRLGNKQGGADKFLDFIEYTLKPLIAADYPIDRSRQVLMGHSLGGLFTLHALFTRPEAFQSYVAVSPSIWWNDQYLLKELDQFAQRQQADPVSPKVQISLGEREQSENTQDNGTRSAAEALASQLRSAEYGKLPVSFRVHAGETHGSVVPIALVRALPDALR